MTIDEVALLFLANYFHTKNKNLLKENFLKEVLVEAFLGGND